MKQWPLNKAYFWETAPFFRILLPFVAGIVCYDAGLHFSIHYALLLFTATAVLFTFTAYKKFHHATGFIFLHIAIAIAGWILCHYNDIRNDPGWFGNNMKKAAAFVAVLSKNPQEKDKTYKLDVTVQQKLRANDMTCTKGKAFVYIYKEKQALTLKAGDTILVSNSWQPIKNAGNPFEFDYTKYCQRNNILYQQFVAGSEIKYAGTEAAARNFLGSTHDYCMETLQYYIKDTATLGIIQAMLIGDEENFDQELKQAYSETGIIHIIAISGSHITVFFFVISFLLSWIRKKKYRWIKYAVALPLIWFYVVMAGAPPSAVRAAAMFSLLAIGFVLQKSNNSLNQLFATAFILLCAQPMWLFSLGFQLSFIAVLALILFYKPIYRLYTPPNVILRGLWATISASLAAELLVAPLVIYYFHIFPILFIAANIVAYCFMGIVLLGGMGIIIFSFAPPVAIVISTVCTFLTGIFNYIIIFLQKLNPDSFHYLKLSGPELILFYVIIASFAAYILRGIKPALFVGLTVACLFISLLCYDEWIALNQERLVVYNMNRGSYIELIKGKEHQTLYTDTLTSPEKKSYTLNAAHTGWHAWMQSKIQPSEFFMICNKTVLLLNKPSSVSQPFAVDYLVLNYAVKPADIPQLQQVYAPEMIVQSGYVSRQVAEQCKLSARESHINLHTTMLDGAYIIEPH